jgi:hypothetical protein
LTQLSEDVRHLRARIEQAHDDDATAHPDLRRPDRHRQSAPYTNQGKRSPGKSVHDADG